MLVSKFTNDFIKSVLTLMTGTAMAQAIPVLISPILTRLYSPEQFGMWALYMSLAVIFGTIANGRYELSIMLPENRAMAINIFWLSCGIALFTTIFMGFVVALISSNVIELISMSNFEYWLYALPVSVLLIGFWQALSNWHNREKNYKKMALARIVQAFTNAALAVLFGVIGFDQGLIVSLLVSQAVIVLILLYGSGLDKISNKYEIKKAAIRYKHFPQFDVWSALLNTASIQLPILLFSIYYTAESVGQYALAHRVLSLPISLIGSAVAQVYFQKAARLSKDKALAQLTENTYSKLLLIGCLFLSFPLFYGEYVFAYIFGEDWKEAGGLAGYLSLWLIFNLAGNPISSLYNVLEKQRAGFKITIFVFLLRMVSLVLPMSQDLEFDYVVISYVIAGTLVWLIQMFVLFKFAGCNYNKVLIAMLLVFIIITLQFAIKIGVEYVFVN